MKIPYIPCWCNECGRLIEGIWRRNPKKTDGFFCHECWLKTQPALRQLAEVGGGNDE